MHESNISGADDPRAMSVKLATVSFHILISTTSGSWSFGSDDLTVTFFTFDVIRSMAHMNMSAMMAMPRNRYIIKKKYAIA